MRTPARTHLEELAHELGASPRVLTAKTPADSEHRLVMAALRSQTVEAIQVAAGDECVQRGMRRELLRDQYFGELIGLVRRGHQRVRTLEREIEDLQARRARLAALLTPSPQ